MIVISSRCLARNCDVFNRFDIEFMSAIHRRTDIQNYHVIYRASIASCRKIYSLYFAVCSAHLMLLKRGIAKTVMSVCLSVSLSVTLVSHAYTVQHVEINFPQDDRAIFLVSWGQISVLSLWVHPEREYVKEKYPPLLNAKNWPISTIYWKGCSIVLSSTIAYELSNGSEIGDLEWPWTA